MQSFHLAVGPVPCVQNDFSAVLVEPSSPNASVSSDVDPWVLSLGLDLEERTVLEAEVLMWRLANDRSGLPFASH